MAHVLSPAAITPEPYRPHADRRPSAGTVALVAGAHLALFALLLDRHPQPLTTGRPALMIDLLASPAATAATVVTLPTTAATPARTAQQIRSAARRARPQPLTAPAPIPRSPTLTSEAATTPASPMPAVSPVLPSAPAGGSERAAAGHSAGTASASLTTAPASAPMVPLSEPRFDADYLANPAPAYPPLSRRLGEEGRVLLRVYVEASGRPGRIELKTSSDSPRLDAAAQDAVRRWQFVPARRGDDAVDAWVLVPVVFNLKG
ncbi:MAG TPA: energy transducer TonB [Azospira sp.]|nr:energy transducer TonB [Azospira sp.]